MVLPAEAIAELLYSHCRRKRSITETERTETRGSKAPPIVERIALDQNPFWLFEVTLAMLLPFSLVSDPFASEKTQLGKSMVRPICWIG